jgi:hypothetical protein
MAESKAVRSFIAALLDPIGDDGKGVLLNAMLVHYSPIPHSSLPITHTE